MNIPRKIKIHINTKNLRLLINLFQNRVRNFTFWQLISDKAVTINHITHQWQANKESKLTIMMIICKKKDHDSL